jgi:glycine dehydrogenase subunit 2
MGDDDRLTHRGRTIFERSVPGHRACPKFEVDVPPQPALELLPKHLRRDRPADLPEITLEELVEHYGLPRRT